MIKILYLVLGSIAGGLARYFLAGAVYEAMGLSSTDLPYGTILVNLIGCFLIGFLSSFGGDRFSLGSNERLLLMTGFCGAFTTFSTFMLDTNNLLKDGEIFGAFLNIAVSLIAGFIVFKLGSFLGGLI